MLSTFHPIKVIKIAKLLNSQLYSAVPQPNLKPLNAKLSGFMKNGLTELAEDLFDRMPHKNTVTYNTMIRGYFRNGFSGRALDVFNQMPVRDIFSYNTTVCGLMQCGDVLGAKQIFECMGEKDVVTWNTMLSGYVDNCMLHEAVCLFNGMPVKDVFSWNLVIAGLVKSNELRLAEEFFRRMGKRDVASWTIMMKAYLAAGRIYEARGYFDDMGMRDMQAWNTMMEGYIENGFVTIAEGLFHKMQERDCTTWNVMINGLISVGRISDAIRLFSEMPWIYERSWNLIMLGIIRNGLVKVAHAFLEKRMSTDVVSWTNLIVGYLDLGETENAVKVFELMASRDTTAWNAMIFGLGENDQGEDGVSLFIRMKREYVMQDEATYTSVLTLCANLPSLNLGKQIHAEAIKAGLTSFISVGNAMLTMYFRCGNLESAVLHFHSMPCHDVISWNSIICGLAHHGLAEKALEMFRKMTLTGVKHNEITFVGVLSACSYAGLVEEGRYQFSVMKNDYSLRATSEHYTCIVDLLGRFGLIDEAISIINEMRVDGIKIPASVWGALFGACRMHKNFKMAEVAGEKILELEPSNSAVYMILAEIYLASGRRQDAEKMWVRMKNKGVKKQPGCSWIESKNSCHIFLSGDKTHPDLGNISHILELMKMEMETESTAFGHDSEI